VATETKKSELAVPTTTDELRALLGRAQKGDKAVLPVLGKLLENPVYVEMFGGDLAANVESSFVKALSGQDLAVREAIHAKLRAMRRELLDPEATPLERLLVERIVACWLQVQDAEVRSAQGQGNLTIRQADYHERRMDATSRRYLAAIKALALVRRLALPALQINLARKQVNVVAPHAVTT
jgi:hypothetical protein